MTMNCYTLSFCSLRKFFRRPIITDARFDERLFYHEDREGHEGRIRKVNLTNNKSSFVLFVRFVMISIFPFWLRLCRTRFSELNVRGGIQQCQPLIPMPTLLRQNIPGISWIALTKNIVP